MCTRCNPYDICPTVHTLANTLEWDTIEIVQFDDVLLDEESNMQNDINVSTSKENSDGSSNVVEGAEIEDVQRGRSDE